MSDLPAKQYNILITLEYGSSYEYYINDTSPITLGSDTFLSMPEMSVALPEFTGEFEEDPAMVDIALSSAIATVLADNRAQPLVTVKIEDIDPVNIGTRRPLYQGIVTGTTDNSEGIEDMIALQVSGPKPLLREATLGIVVGASCDHVFGDDYCSVNRTALADATRTIVSISGKTVTISGSDPSRETYFHKGTIDRGGISIDIRSAVDLVLELTEQPPVEWGASDSVTMYPGCEKTIESCRNFTKIKDPANADSTFRGLGIRMPTVSPIMGSVSAE
ncbi:MAG: hypothetical protein GY845_25930 [Planctomycetes bacterium]|nr:hypothetical protein [Planctomycetota bacterium]